MQRGVWLVVIGALAACGGAQEVTDAPTVGPADSADEAPSAAHAEASASEAGTSADVREPSSVAEDTCADVGYDTVPLMPSSKARRLNAEALKAHRGGDYATALEGFRATLAESPGYDIVRFNAACALAKLGRLDEARQELAALLTADLPSYASKLRQDEDLAALRDDAELRVLVGRVADCTREAAPVSVPLVAYRNVTSRGWAQAVVYRHETKRVVPVSPKVRLRISEMPPHYIMIAPLFEAATGRTLFLTYSGNDAEDSHLDGVRVRAFRGPLGELLFDHRGPPPEELPFVTADLTETGALLKGPGFGHGPWVFWEVDERGLRRTKNGDVTAPYLGAGATSWGPVFPAAEGYRVERNRLFGPRGEFELGRGHAAQDSRVVYVNEEDSVAVVVSTSSGNCSSPDRYIVDVVSLEDGRRSRPLDGQGQVVVYLAGDGALYVQTRREMRRYPDPLEDSYELLPDGLGISTNPWGFNPYC